MASGWRQDGVRMRQDGVRQASHVCQGRGVGVRSASGCVTMRQEGVRVASGRRQDNLASGWRQDDVKRRRARVNCRREQGPTDHPGWRDALVHLFHTTGTRDPRLRLVHPTRAKQDAHTGQRVTSDGLHPNVGGYRRGGSLSSPHTGGGIPPAGGPPVHPQRRTRRR